MTARSQVSRAEWLLWAGVAIGLSLAVATLAGRTRERRDALPPGAVAMVNGQAIRTIDYGAEVRARHSAESGPTAEREKRDAVERLVEEELIVEEGLSLDLVRRDPATRHALLDAVFESERGIADAPQPSEDALARYYEGIREELRRPGKLHVRQLVTHAEHGVDVTVARARAEEAAKRLRSGEPFERVNAALGTPSEAALPDALSAEELGGRTGPVTLERVLSLEPGGVTEPLGNGGLFRVIQLVGKDPPYIPALGEVREHVLALYRRKAQGDAFAAWLAAHRRNATVHVAEKLP